VNAKPISAGWLVIIGGEYQFFRHREDAARERAEYEVYHQARRTDPDDEVLHYEPFEVFEPFDGDAVTAAADALYPRGTTYDPERVHAALAAAFPALVAELEAARARIAFVESALRGERIMLEHSEVSRDAAVQRADESEAELKAQKADAERYREMLASGLPFAS
jgi:hypothetical protein